MIMTNPDYDVINDNAHCVMRSGYAYKNQNII